MVSMLCLLDDINDMLDAPIIGSFLRAAVAGPDLRRGEVFTVDLGFDLVIGLHVKRGPAKIA